VIRATFLPLEGYRQWLAVCVPIRQNEHLLCVGYVRYSSAASAWIARLRSGGGANKVLVKMFRDRADAAKWLLTAGGYAVDPRAVQGVAA
jgi:hypothetical protein